MEQLDVPYFESMPLEGAQRICNGIPLDRRCVLLGESTHGTEEFYRTRVEITKRLIEERGFTG
jgi:erythromycin esterase-like protein